MTINYPPTSEREFIKLYLQLYNTLLPEPQRLLPSEVDLITEFMLLPDEKFNYQRFGHIAKNKVIESAKEHGWPLTKLNINNKLYALLDKQFLRRDEDKVIYLPKHLIQAFSSYRKSNGLTVNINFKNEHRPNADGISETPVRS